MKKRRSFSWWKNHDRKTKASLVVLELELFLSPSLGTVRALQACLSRFSFSLNQCCIHFNFRVDEAILQYTHPCLIMCAHLKINSLHTQSLSTNPYLFNILSCVVGMKNSARDEQFFFREISKITHRQIGSVWEHALLKLSLLLKNFLEENGLWWSTHFATFGG